MCRHVSYLGPPATLQSLLIDPPHSLYRQSWAPRRQRHGTVNADGFGIGWYADGDPVPARYRRGVPIWGDPSLASVARVTRSAAVLAAVRSATEGTAAGEQAAAPFGEGPWLFSHNGRLDGWPESAAALAGSFLPSEAAGRGEVNGAAAAASPALRAALSLEAMVDSAFLWRVVLDRLRAGHPVGTALGTATEAIVAAGASGRFNFLLTDGRTIAATAWGDTLWFRAPAGAATGVTVASEPSDDEPGWTEVPDRHLLVATAREITLRPLAAASASGHRNPPRTRTDDVVSTEGIVTA